MTEQKLSHARELVEAWRKDADADLMVRSDELEDLVQFACGKVRRRLGAGVAFAALCPDCNRPKSNEDLHPPSSECKATSKSDSPEYLQLLMAFLESAMLQHDSLIDARDAEEAKDEALQVKEQVKELEGEVDELKGKLAEVEHEKESVEFELSELNLEVERMKEEREAEAKARKYREGEVKLLILTARTALRFRDKESLKIFKSKLREVEASIYQGVHSIDAWVEDYKVGDEIDDDDIIVVDPPSALSDSATWSLPPLPDSIAERRQKFGPIGATASKPLRSSSIASSRGGGTATSRRRHHSSGSSSDCVHPLKALSLKTKGEGLEGDEKVGDDDSGEKGDEDKKGGEVEKKKKKEEEEEKEEEKKKKKEEEEEEKKRKKKEEEEKKKKERRNSRKSVRWSAVPVAPL